MIKIGVLISGGGTNLQAIIDACRSGDLPAKVSVVISNKADAYGLERAKKAGIDQVYTNDDERILATLQGYDVDIVVLAGYLKLIAKDLVQAFEGRMLNIHPSILPSFPGKDAVGQALDYGVRVTGATVHYVDSGMDTGEIIDQLSCKVYPDDTRETLQLRIQNLEYELYPRVMKEIIQ